MAQKIYDKQGNIYYFKSSTRDETVLPVQLMNNQITKQLATALGLSLNIQLHDKQLTYLLGYTSKGSNLDAIVLWLTEQNICEPISHDEFKKLHDKLLVCLTDITNNFSSFLG